MGDFDCLTEMEKLKQGWNYGTTKRSTKKEDETKQNEQNKGMTVREHMTQPMSDHEWFLFVMLLVLIATFLIVYFNPLENPLTEKKLKRMIFQQLINSQMTSDRCYDNV